MQIWGGQDEAGAIPTYDDFQRRTLPANSLEPPLTTAVSPTTQLHPSDGACRARQRRVICGKLGSPGNHLQLRCLPGDRH